MHQLFSRYGGHMHIIGKGKASTQDLPLNLTSNMKNNNILKIEIVVNVL